MRVLMVCHAAPCTPALGPAQRHLGLFEVLAERHHVSVVTLAKPGEREQFEHEHRGRYENAIFVPKRSKAHDRVRILTHFMTGHGHIRHVHDRRIQQAMDQLFATTRFDVVYVSTVLLGCYRWPFDLPSIGDAHNVEHEVCERISRVSVSPAWKAYYRMQAFLTKRDEERLTRRFSAIWATSERDATYFAATRGDERVFVVPNGVHSTEEPPPRYAPDGQLVLLYVGLMSYWPNADAADYLLNRILPRIRQQTPARLQIVGANPPKWLRARAGPDIEVTDWVADVAPYYQRASVFVVPLRAGGGTRLKILEAMQHRVPIVSTSIGCEGLHARDGEALLLADTAEHFADAVIRVWQDRALASRLTATSAALVRAEYDWRCIGKTVDRVLTETTTLSRAESTHVTK